jgi:ATP-dependent exoDNAse (exonuclease V) alpha subunit
MFSLLADTHPTVQLEHVHRFTRAWERQTSLALRAGRTTALADYHAHGRLHDNTAAGIERQVVEHWTQLRGRGTVAVLCATNQSARRLNTRLQAARVAVGEIRDDREGRQLPNGQCLQVGDVVATRRNDRSLTTTRGVMVKNRARWEVRAIARDGSLVLTGRDGTVTLPPGYVDGHVELAYAETIHAAQGRTVDHCLLVVDGPIDGPAVYVGLTRGRETNNAYVATDGERAIDVLETSLTQSWGDRPAAEIERELGQAEPAMGRTPAGLSL